MTEALEHPEAPPSPVGETPVEVLLQVDPRTGEGWLVLAAVAGDVLEIPITKADAARLARGLLAFANPRAFAARIGALSREAGHG